MDVSLLQEVNVSSSNHEDVSTFKTFFFFFNYDCILHKCCAISNQYHFTNPIRTFLPKFQGGVRTPGPPPLDPPMTVTAKWFMFFLDFRCKPLVLQCPDQRKNVTLLQGPTKIDPSSYIRTILRNSPRLIPENS